MRFSLLKALAAMALTMATLALPRPADPGTGLLICKGVCTTSAQCNGCLCFNPNGTHNGGGCVRDPPGFAR
jgi:hypothetical protein